MLQTVNFTGKLLDKEKTEEATSCLSYLMMMTCQDPSPLVLKQALNVTCQAKKFTYPGLPDGTLFKPCFSEMGILLIFFHTIVSSPLDNDDKFSLGKGALKVDAPVVQKM